jgi:hypothetical protein
MLQRKLEGSYVYYTTDKSGAILGIVEKSDDEYYAVRWYNSPHSAYSAPFTEQEFYDTGHSKYPTRWDIALDGSVSEQEKLAFRIKHGI